MGDGRCTNGDRIVREDYRKVIKLTDNLIIGFTGRSDMCEKSIERLRQCINLDAYSAANIIHEFAVTQKYCGLKSSFVIASKDLLGMVQLSTYHMESDAITHYDLTFDKTRYVALSPDNVNGDSILVKHLNDSSNNIYSKMKAAIKEVASLDFTVNENITYEVI